MKKVANDLFLGGKRWFLAHYGDEQVMVSGWDVGLFISGLRVVTGKKDMVRSDEEERRCAAVIACRYVWIVSRH